MFHCSLFFIPWSNIKEIMHNFKKWLLWASDRITFCYIPRIIIWFSLVHNSKYIAGMPCDVALTVKAEAHHIISMTMQRNICYGQYLCSITTLASRLSSLLTSKDEESNISSVLRVHRFTNECSNGNQTETLYMFIFQTQNCTCCFFSFAHTLLRLFGIISRWIWRVNFHVFS